MRISALLSKLLKLFSSSSNQDKPSSSVEIKVPVKTSKPIVYSSSNTINSYKSQESRELLKQATQLKKAKEYDLACKKLKEAYECPDANNLMVKDRLRLPMYLQLAGRNDEAWRILNELNAEYTDVFSQADIAKQMRVFLQKEKRFKNAILYSIWSIAKDIERDKFNTQSSIEMTDQLTKLHSKYGYHRDNEEAYGYTPKGNPITDRAYELFSTRLTVAMSVDGVFSSIEKDLKKAKLQSYTQALAEDISAYFLTAESYELGVIRDIVSKHITE